MNINERKFFRQLCKFKSENMDASLLEFATSNVLGQLFFNRMQAVAYGNLKKKGLLGKVTREFRNSLKAAYEQNLEKNYSFYKCVALLSEIFYNYTGKIAMLKGAILCAEYPDGYRTSNDIDLLVLPSEVTAIGNILSQAGFKQGNVRNDEFIPATRKEIIESKMLRGETVPYIKQVDLPYMKYLEVDINFSLDYKNEENTLLADILEKSCIREVHGISIPTLSKEDFFIHLCAHLYKEATTLPWIEMHRDMTLYKYCDIYVLLSQMSDSDIDFVFKRATQIGMEKICAYTILDTIDLFEMHDSKAKQISEKTLLKCPEFRLQVVSPKQKKTLVYQTKDVTKRFFMNDRIKDLKEEKNNEKT